MNKMCFNTDRRRKAKNNIMDIEILISQIIDIYFKLERVDEVAAYCSQLAIHRLVEIQEERARPADGKLNG